MSEEQPPRMVRAIDFDQLIDEELKDLHWIMDERIKVPRDAFEKYGLCGFRLSMNQTYLDDGLEIPGFDAEQGFQEAKAELHALCEATPNASPKCVLALSMAYFALACCSDERFREKTDEDRIRQLIVASQSKGFLLSTLPGASDNALADHAKRRKESKAREISVEEARSVMARVQANARHAPSQTAKAVIVAKYRGERDRFASKDDAADHYTKDHPYEFSTIRKWLKGI